MPTQLEIMEKLCYPISTRIIDYKNAVIQEWGVEYSRKDVVYRFSNGRQFLDPTTAGGPYGPQDI